MKKTDGRHLSEQTLEHLRKQAVVLNKKGKIQSEIAESFGVSRVTIGTWLKKHRHHGKKAFKSEKRGRKFGEKRTLTIEQETRIQRIIQEKTPDQLKMPFALWNRNAIKELIQSLYGIDMPIRTVGEYLSRWGFTPQRPLKRAYEQRPEEVKKWLNDQYPDIANRARSEDAEIHWGDETGLSSNSNYSRGYAPRGQTPVLHQNAKRFSMSMISSVTNRGKIRFMCYNGAMNAELFVRFLKRLTKDQPRKIFLIVDNLKVHHSKVVQEWLEEHHDNIELFFLPPYAPEKNPDEYLNRDLKLSLSNKSLARNQDQLKKQLVSHMRKIQKLPKRVKSYFKNHNVLYAQ
jgi:transposase